MRPSRGKDGQTQISALETERKSLTEKIKQAREAEKVSAALPTLYQLKTEVTAEGTSLRDEQETWKKRASDAEKVQNSTRRNRNKIKNSGRAASAH